MQKFLSYLVVATMIVLVALMSCDKDDKRPSDEECICIHSNKSGQIIGNENISTETLEAFTFIMYPNPTSDVAYLTFKTTGLNTVTITDKKGKILLEQSFDVQTIAINVREYSTGEYRVKVDNGMQKSILCLIKVEN